MTAGVWKPGHEGQGLDGWGAQASVCQHPSSGQSSHASKKILAGI